MMLCLSFPYLYVGQVVATNTGEEEVAGEEGCEGILTICTVLQAAQRDALRRGRCSLQTLLARLHVDLRRGLDAGGESVITGVLCARAEAVIHSSLCLFGKRKGVCGLSLGETEWGFSGGGQVSWLGLPEQPCHVPVCVSREQTGPWYRP